MPSAGCSASNWTASASRFSISEWRSPALAELIKATQHVARGVQKAFNPGGMRIVQFNEGVAGQTVFHIHFHIIPCYEGVPLRTHNRDWADKAVLAQHAERVRQAL